MICCEKVGFEEVYIVAEEHHSGVAGVVTKSASS